MRKLTTLVALLLGAGAVFAADGTLDEARRCAQVQDSLQRLVCYDRIFPAAPGTVPPAVTSPSSPAAAPAAAHIGPPEFGSDALKRPVEEREAPAALRSLTATVKSLSQTRPDVYRMTLDNGQVWQQQEKDSRFYLSVGDTVELNRGALGSYTMSRTSGGRSSWVRVNRVK